MNQPVLQRTKKIQRNIPVIEVAPPHGSVSDTDICVSTDIRLTEIALSDPSIFGRHHVAD